MKSIEKHNHRGRIGLALYPQYMFYLLKNGGEYTNNVFFYYKECLLKLGTWAPNCTGKQRTLWPLECNGEEAASAGLTAGKKPAGAEIREPPQYPRPAFLHNGLWSRSRPDDGPVQTAILLRWILAKLKSLVKRPFYLLRGQVPAQAASSPSPNHLPPGFLQLVEWVSRVVPGGSQTQDLVVLISGSLQTFRTAV